jgi:hypothetical protein
MKYELIDIWLSHGDGGERGTGPIIGICDSRVKAVVIAKGKAWYGGDGIVFEGKALKISDGDGGNPKYFLLNSNFTQEVVLNANLPERTKNLQKLALSKLTDFEVNLLGLDDMDKKLKRP